MAARCHTCSSSRRRVDYSLSPRATATAPEEQSTSHINADTLLLLLRPSNGLFSRTTWVSRYQKGKTSLDLNEARDDGVWGWQTICTSLHTDNHTNTSSLNFYRPDALPDAQQTVLTHGRHVWRHFNLYFINSNRVIKVLLVVSSTL